MTELQTEFADQEDLIKAWKQASEAEKMAKKQIDICKKSCLVVDVELNTPIYGEIGVKESTRTTRKVKLADIRDDFTDDDLALFTKVEIGKLEKFMNEALENGDRDEDEYNMIMDRVENDKTTTFYQLTDFSE
jgi:hypothetical protein